MRLVTLVRPVCALLAAAAVGCSGGNSASNATLAGTAVGQAAMQVSVVGGKSSTTTDSTGAFTLTGVSAGATALHFAGAGVDATLSIAAVVPNEYRELVVSFAGGAAKEQLDRSSTEFSGAVTGLGSSAIAVAGRTVRVSSNTFVTDGDITLSTAELIGGETVTVEGALQADGSIRARTIELGEGDLTLTDGGCAMTCGGGHDDADGGHERGEDGGVAGGGDGDGDADGGSHGGHHHDVGGGHGGGDGDADGGPEKGDDGGSNRSGHCGNRPPHSGGPGLAHAMGAIVSIDPASESFVIGTTTVDTNSATIYGGGLTFATLAVGATVAVVGTMQADGSILAVAIQAAP